jgi:glycine dehydrogenase subunit 2
LDVPLIFERSREGRRGIRFPAADVPEYDEQAALPADLCRQTPLGLPEVAENDVVRHYTGLSQLNYAIDKGFYPLGSCTMKYNPKVNEWVAALPGFLDIHPLQPEETVQGMLEVLWTLEHVLAEIAGMDAVTLQPAAGAHGELTGILLIRRYLEERGEKRGTVLVPDSAHGTNPATAAMAGFRVGVVPSNARGGVDVNALRGLVGDDTAAIMLTNPNTLGLFEEDILEIAEIVHEAGGLVYYDGANANAVLGRTRPGDMGFDVVHLNLHKTFSTPHGGGGPGAGPVGVKRHLEPYLPGPRLQQAADGTLAWNHDRPLSIGKVRSYYGNAGILLRALTYIQSHGADGLRQVADMAVLNANYLKHRLSPQYQTAYDRSVMHEFVLSLADQRERGASALDVAKRLIDVGFYPPTVYFPLVVREAMMVEPTETESKETLDAFADALLTIDREIADAPQQLHDAPHTTPVRRLDEAEAARHPRLRWQPESADREKSEELERR